MGVKVVTVLPEFDIDPQSRSNGIGGGINGGPDFTNFRSPLFEILQIISV
ncbi:MAG: hypothetical protein IPQ18_08875 [Saprospiraceae bacterium]|nr:hypothetical protein [Saprospiraceae bacterium]